MRQKRVLVLAARKVTEDDDLEDEVSMESDLILIGLVGIMDPPREEVHDAIAKCQKAGIKVKMITGDQALTALAIGKDLNIVETDEISLTGRDLESMPDDTIDEAIRETDIFSPNSRAEDEDCKFPTGTGRSCRHDRRWCQ